MQRGELMTVNLTICHCGEVSVGGLAASQRWFLLVWFLSDFLSLCRRHTKTRSCHLLPCERRLCDRATHRHVQIGCFPSATLPQPTHTHTHTNEWLPSHDHMTHVHMCTLNGEDNTHSYRRWSHRHADNRENGVQTKTCSYTFTAGGAHCVPRTFVLQSLSKITWFILGYLAVKVSCSPTIINHNAKMLSKMDKKWNFIKWNLHVIIFSTDITNNISSTL